MSHAPPPVPREQRSPGAKTDKTAADAASGEPAADRRDLATEAQSADPGDADVNTDQQGRFGDIAQNTRHQGHQQDR